MTEQQEQQPAIILGPGEILRQAREARGLSVADIANKLHLKQANIEAIEADAYDPAVSLTFTKGYLKLYAKHVNVPEATVLEAFAAQNVDEKEPAKLQSFSQRVAKQANDDRLMLLTYLIIAVLVALVVVWWFQQDSTEPVVIGETNPAVQPVASQANTEVESQAPVASNDAFTTDTTPIEQPGDSALAAASLAEPDPAAAEQTEALQSPAITSEQQAEPAPVSDTVELVFEFSNDCWMNLTDATGEAIAYGVKKAGRVMTVSGVAPFEVTLGAPQYVQIEYAGEAVDMSRFGAGSTAKFNLPFSQ